MNKQQLAKYSEELLRQLLKFKLSPDTQVYLFGSRARGDARWNSDYDLWINTELDILTLSEINEIIEESIIPFKIDLITSNQLKGEFGRKVREEAKRWI